MAPKRRTRLSPPLLRTRLSPSVTRNRTSKRRSKDVYVPLPPRRLHPPRRPVRQTTPMPGSAANGADMAWLLRMWPQRMDGSPPIPPYLRTPLPPPRPSYHFPDEAFHKLTEEVGPWFLAREFYSLAGILDDIADGM